MLLLLLWAALDAAGDAAGRAGESAVDVRRAV